MTSLIYVAVMESDEVVREMLVHSISACGHQVIGFPDAKGVLGAMYGVTFNLLVTGIGDLDESIPGMLIEAKGLQPRIRIVIGQSQAHKILPPRIANASLQSPFSMDELRFAMNKALDAAPMSRRYTDP